VVYQVDVEDWAKKSDMAMGDTEVAVES
jgi:hypothetical protein